MNPDDLSMYIDIPQDTNMYHKPRIFLQSINEVLIRHPPDPEGYMECFQPGLEDCGGPKLLGYDTDRRFLGVAKAA